LQDNGFGLSPTDSGNDVKVLLALAVIVGLSAAQWVWGQALLVSSGSTADRWNRSCRYYFPMRVFEVTLPLSQECPRLMEPR